MLQPSAPYHSLYLHVPFCKNICDYCDLYSIVDNENSSRVAYLNKIEQELQLNKANLLGLKSIFVGGGTPSQLTPHEMKAFFKSVNTFSAIESEGEFTVECNPVSITKEKLQILKDAGVNRLSFGAQSTTRKTRNSLGRRTSRNQLEKALSEAIGCGFQNINIDLIYAVPGQSVEDWKEDLETALSYDLPHYSAYSLILEENTEISKRFESVDDDMAVDMYDLTEEILSTRELQRYEISNYAKAGKECRHNYDIWKGATYLGIGPAATSFNGKFRWTQIRDLKKWLDGHDPEIDQIPLKDRLGEIISFGFRTIRGWKINELKNLLNHNSLELFSEVFEKLIAENLIENSSHSYKPTKQGLLFADYIAESFIFS